MKIGVFYPEDNNVHRETLEAFCCGLRAVRDDEIIFASLKKYLPVDIAVVFGVHKPAVSVSHDRGRVISAQRRNNRFTIILERGYVQRDKYYSAGFYSTAKVKSDIAYGYKTINRDTVPHGLNGRAFFNNAGSRCDRWLDLRVDIDPLTKPDDGHILLVGQVHSDASVQHCNHALWLKQVASEIKMRSDRKIVYRPHPLNSVVAAVPGTVLSQGPLDDDLYNAYAVVTFNSNVGVDALIRGKHVFSADVGAMVHGVSSHDLDDLSMTASQVMRSTPMQKRVNFLSDLAYTQWTHEEMAIGLPIQHLFSATIGVDSPGHSFYGGTFIYP